MDIQLPRGAQCVIQLLEKAGYEAYIVGGCVRDSLLGRTPKDWDITTNATPEQMIAALESLTRREVFDMGVLLFELVPTGIAYGTVTIFVQMIGQTHFDRESYEVTTYRTEGRYSDGRHPDSVEFTPSLQEDLSRRDFTINAMAYHPSRGLVDLYDGVLHLQKKVIHAVRNPDERFDEDKLRMLRAIRFSCQLGFIISMSTFGAIENTASKIDSVSAERIQAELVKMVMSDSPTQGIMLMHDSGLLQYVLPELEACYGFQQDNPWHLYDVYYHILKAVDSLPTYTDLVTRLATLFHDVGKVPCKVMGDDGIAHFPNHPEKGSDMVRDILTRLRFSNDIVDSVCVLITYHDVVIRPEKPLIKRLVNKLGDPALFPKLIEVRKADIAAHHPDYIKDGRLERALASLEVYQQVMAEMECMKVTDLKVDGHDVMAKEFEGKEVGEVLRGLLDLVIDEVVENDRDKLLALIAFKRGKTDVRITDSKK